MVRVARAFREHHVLGLQVPVDQSGLVCVDQCGADGVHDLERPGLWKASLGGDGIGQGVTVHVLHGQEQLAGVGGAKDVNLDHMRVVQACSRPRFALEAFHGGRASCGQFRVEDLDHHRAFHVDLLGQVHRAHPAASKQALDPKLLVEDLADKAGRRGCHRAERLTPAWMDLRCPGWLEPLRGSGTAMLGGIPRRETCRPRLRTPPLRPGACAD